MQSALAEPPVRAVTWGKTWHTGGWVGTHSVGPPAESRLLPGTQTPGQRGQGQTQPWGLGNCALRVPHEGAEAAAPSASPDSGDILTTAGTSHPTSTQGTPGHSQPQPSSARGPCARQEVAAELSSVQLGGGHRGRQGGLPSPCPPHRTREAAFRSVRHPEAGQVRGQWVMCG